MLFEEDGHLGRREVVVVTGVLGVRVAGSVASFEVPTTVVGRAAGDNDGLLEAAVEGVAGAFVTGGVHGTLAVVAGGIEAVGDVSEFAHTVVGSGEGTLEDVSFVVGGHIGGLHHDGAFKLSVRELSGGSVRVGVRHIARVLDVSILFVGRDRGGRGAERFRLVPEAEVDVGALAARLQATARRAGVVSEVPSPCLGDRDRGSASCEQKNGDESSHC